MKLTRLKITGFKSFVDGAEFLIEPGLTGVVGPNGCGKSNLVEALRWVMGENSFKNMRASGMDDVIFAGSGGRPARNSAEVVITIDNADRTAPAAFNGADLLEVSRKIEREEGSTYRINGREVRARDVQLLFADAATGARSPAMVRQGQIGEIIAAKPQARRRILEDAAGIAGLHSRRHEAELRLKAAEDNLTRLDDVLGEIDGQIDSLKRQSKQAARYRTLSASIRQAEATLQALSFVQAREQAAAAERALNAETGLVADRTREQTEAARRQAVAAHEIQPLREAEASAAAALQRLNTARGALEAEERRAGERTKELTRRAAEIETDLAREAASGRDAEASLARLAAEETELADADANSAGMAAQAARAAEAAEAALAEAEAALSVLQASAADIRAKRAGLQRRVDDERQRLARIDAEKHRVDGELASLGGGSDPASELPAFAAAVEAAGEAAALADAQVSSARERLGQLREAESTARNLFGEADRRHQRLETEIRTLQKLLGGQSGDAWPAVLDEIKVTKGVEVALGAALGDELDASSNASAPAHWADSGSGEQDPALPEGVDALIHHVTAPAAMARTLRQIGLVERSLGPSLRTQLLPGQRLVSREGDLWRWDGFTAAAEAPSAAARRLAERNRLDDLVEDARAAGAAAAQARHGLTEAEAAVKREVALEAAAIETLRGARQALDRARAQLADAERRVAQHASRTAAMREAAQRLGADHDDAAARLAEAEAALAGLEPTTDLDADILAARTNVAEARTTASQARANMQGLAREGEIRTRRRLAISAEMAQWRERAGRAEGALKALEERRAAITAETAALAEASPAYAERRRRLTNEIEQANGRRKAAADDLARAETALAAADKAARSALDALSAAREARAGAEARLEAAKAKLGEVVRQIQETLQITPDTLVQQAGLRDGAPVDAPTIESRLALLKAERERLGPVNLRAEDELAELSEKRDGLLSERDDLTEAIRRLRQAIGNLNREGRERLLAAFEVVNGHFQRLFTTLFGGGMAELTLVDSDDPLEAGLDILARPPGKKPQTMTLLSGGEQALTATALIFAVFLTNPSPICVLDEVDAPLDDANVERYCDLLDDMARQTQTRFIVITHNPITMARMDRLFGVTMAERGVSELVSVDLGAAARLVEAL